MLKLVILSKQELECFTYDVRSVGTNELSVLVQVVSHFFLEANLKGL
jgi:hypothetical protein